MIFLQQDQHLVHLTACCVPNSTTNISILGLVIDISNNLGKSENITKEDL